MILLFELRLLFFFFFTIVFHLGSSCLFCDEPSPLGEFSESTESFLSCYQIFKKGDCVLLGRESGEYIYLTDNLPMWENFVDKGS